MNNLKYFCILVFLYSAACSPKTILQTDTGQTIDLSGKWTKTDAEIAASQLFNEMVESGWLKSFKANSNFRPTILVGTLENDFNDELANQQLQTAFQEIIEESRHFQLITSDDTSIPYFILVGEINSQAFEQNNESGINYKLNVSLINTEGEVVWAETDRIKKYLKE